VHHHVRSEIVDFFLAIETESLGVDDVVVSFGHVFDQQRFFGELFGAHEARISDFDMICDSIADHIHVSLEGFAVVVEFLVALWTLRTFGALFLEATLVVFVELKGGFRRESQSAFEAGEMEVLDKVKIINGSTEKTEKARGGLPRERPLTLVDRPDVSLQTFLVENQVTLRAFDLLDKSVVNPHVGVEILEAFHLLSALIAPEWTALK
jgi:hypothetical protein